mmetsp:Transcript_2279/g.6717  ORF Transcript_2279/g.6717 Transcript_2279/m.6717 type:complete len:294 (-) Transcript_2279:44-925(-)
MPPLPPQPPPMPTHFIPVFVTDRSKTPLPPRSPPTLTRSVQALVTDRVLTPLPPQSPPLSTRTVQRPGSMLTRQASCPPWSSSAQEPHALLRSALALTVRPPSASGASGAAAGRHALPGPCLVDAQDGAAVRRPMPPPCALTGDAEGSPAVASEASARRLAGAAAEEGSASLHAEAERCLEALARMLSLRDEVFAAFGHPVPSMVAPRDDRSEPEVDRGGGCAVLQASGGLAPPHVEALPKQALASTSQEGAACRAPAQAAGRIKLREISSAMSEALEALREAKGRILEDFEE